VFLPWLIAREGYGKKERSFALLPGLKYSPHSALRMTALGPGRRKVTGKSDVIPTMERDASGAAGRSGLLQLLELIINCLVFSEARRLRWDSMY
jgi:hypothetical protein